MPPMEPTPPPFDAVTRPADAFGYETTLIAPLDAERAIDQWDRTVTAFLAHGAATPSRLAAALEAAPTFPLALAAKGYFMLLLGRPELRPTAAEALATLETHAAALTAREAAMTAGLAAYLEGRLAAAADLLDAALAAHPRDALLLKLVHAIRFVLGDAAGMRRSVEAALPGFERGHPHRGFALGCLAFALEETGAYVAAERAGREAVRLTPTDAWGLHAVAHVLDMTNRVGEGVAWISARAGDWRHCNNFGYHIWWHLALFHLDRGEYDEVLRLYDEEIRKERSDDYRDISNAASMLSRLELEGVEVGDRWEELARLSEARVEDGCVVFADLHYLLALGGAGRPAASARLLAALRRTADAELGCMAAVAKASGLRAAEGLRAFASGSYAGAFAALSAAQPALQRVGGSRAQRDVFERIQVEAALRAGLLDEARRALQARARRRGALDRYAETRLARIAELSQKARIAAA